MISLSKIPALLVNISRNCLQKLRWSIYQQSSASGLTVVWMEFQIYLYKLVGYLVLKFAVYLNAKLQNVLLLHHCCMRVPSTNFVTHIKIAFFDGTVHWKFTTKTLLGLHDVSVQNKWFYCEDPLINWSIC